ncbi:scavenger receptor cysteine-rich domain-containing protein DMBT1-like [Mytilus edulis]|uniref:scavenger receptor cysteine-rich domain-containing protein DMBT1-like n=1 Tax=Mytilus edulis TaxID=6550 RepID=UPI0039EE62C5
MSCFIVICLAVFTVIMHITENVNAAIHLTATPYLQTFVSHDSYDGTTYYPEGNYSRDWLITGQIPNYTITIEFTACVLETAKQICLFDNVYIFDGSNVSATLIKQTCCGLFDDTVPFKVNSTNSYMYILFQTDETFSSEGFQISYILHGAPTTTARVNTNKLIPERTPMTTARIITNTNSDPVDSKLTVYIAVGCAVTAMIIICVVCYIIWKKFSNNESKVRDNYTNKHNS